jgi:hypothetical protein
MAQLTESQLITAVNKKIKGAQAKLGGETEMRRILNQAQGDLRLDMDLISAKRTSVPFLVFDGIAEYALPTDIDYDKAISIVPMNEKIRNYIWDRVALKYFFRPTNPIGNELGTHSWLLNSSVDSQYDENKNVYAINFEDASPFLMLHNNMSGLSSAQIVQTAAIAPSNGGTWTAADDATNVRKDTQNFKLDSSCILFDSAGAATDVTITNSTFSSQDLSTFEDKGELHLWVYLPATLPTTITLKWGSSASDYWQKAVTVRKTGLAFKQGWNLLAFDWNNVDSETGTPASTAVDYFSVTFTNSAATALKGYRIDGAYARLGRAVTMEYYTKHIVQASDGTRKEEFTTSSDITVLERQEVNQLIDKAFEIASIELREMKDADRAERKYKERADKLGDRFPSEKELEGTTYYNI